MVFILVQYSLTYQRRLIQLTLFEKLCFNFGIRGMPLQVFTSYLLNRQHYTTIKNTKPQLANIYCGVPQGSVLGPLLIIM